MKRKIVLGGCCAALAAVIGCGSKDDQKPSQSEGNSASGEVKQSAVSKAVSSKSKVGNNAREKYDVEADPVMSPERQTEALLAQVKKAMKEMGCAQAQIDAVDRQIKAKLYSEVSEDEKPHYVCKELLEIGVVPCVIPGNTESDSGGALDSARQIVAEYVKFLGLSPRGAWNVKYAFYRLPKGEKITAATDMKEMMK